MQGKCSRGPGFPCRKQCRLYWRTGKGQGGESARRSHLWCYQQLTWAQSSGESPFRITNVFSWSRRRVSLDQIVNVRYKLGGSRKPLFSHALLLLLKLQQELFVVFVELFCYWGQTYMCFAGLDRGRTPRRRRNIKPFHSPLCVCISQCRARNVASHAMKHAFFASSLVLKISCHSGGGL